MKKILVVAITLLLTAAMAFAQGRGSGGGMMGSGRMSGAPGNGIGQGPGGPEILTAADGTIFLPRTVSDSATGTSTTQLVAISPAGVKAWTITLANRGHLTLSGSYLLSVSQSATDTNASSVTAISVATGATAWSLNLSGHVQSLTPFSGGTYAVVVTPATTAGGIATRSLVAISNTGSILWKLDV